MEGTVYKVSPQFRGWLKIVQNKRNEVLCGLNRIIPCPYGEVQIFDLVNDTYATAFQIFDLGNATAKAYVGTSRVSYVRMR